MTSLPNNITLMRVALVPAFVAAFFVPGTTGRWIAFALFCLAGASDALDGYAARRLGAASDFGKMLDPIADKLLVAAALVMLVADDTLDGLMVIPALIILCREMLVSGLREFLAEADVSLPVTRIAKAKTAVQMVAIGALVLGPSADEIIPGIMTLAMAGLWAAAALTIYTGLAYFRAGFAHVRPAPRRDTGEGT